MRRLILFAAACLLAGCSATAASNTSRDGDDSRGTQDAANWQGTWKLISYTENGETAQADMKWIVEGDHYLIGVEGSTGKDPYPFQLDPSQKHIDVHHHDTPEGTYGGHLKGIYEIRGDSLKVCYDLLGQRYPTSFAAGPGSRQVVYQFERQNR